MTQQVLGLNRRADTWNGIGGRTPRKKELAITNRSGLRVRLAAMLARLANRFHSKIWVTKDDVEVNGKSVMALISFGAAPGEKLHIRVKGIDAAEAMRDRATDPVALR